MKFEISPTVHNAVQVAATAIPGAIATAIIGGGGNNYMAGALFLSSVLSALSQALHFSNTTNNVIHSLPAIVAAVQSVVSKTDTAPPAQNITEAK
jgi:hypothetical protein